MNDMPKPETTAETLHRLANHIQEMELKLHKLDISITATDDAAKDADDHNDERFKTLADAIVEIRLKLDELATNLRNQAEHIDDLDRRTIAVQ